MTNIPVVNILLSSWGNSGYGCNNTTAPTYQDSYELGSVSTTLSFSPISVIDPISSTTIAEGANTTASVVAFGATLNSNETSTIQLQIEVKPSSVAFVGVSTVESTPFFSGVDATVLSPVLPDGAYHWQARAVDAEGNTSSWQTFNGTSTGTDFVVNGLPSATNQLGLNSICPNISSSTKNLIFITHGWDGYGASSSVFAWVQQMKDSIENILPSPSWGVCAYDWTQDANTLSPQDAFNNAKEDGIKVGKVLAQQDFASIHFIAHSAGSNLIQNAADWIESSTPIVSRPKIQLTFLDAYDPKGNMSSYGENPEGSGTTSDWWAE